MSKEEPINDPEAVRILTTDHLGDDETYAEKFVNDAMGYRQKGAYHAMARRLNLREGGVHLDLCTGPGIMLHTVKSIRRDAVAIGVEINHQMTGIAKGLIPLLAKHNDEAMNATVWGQFNLELKDGVISRQYTPSQGDETPRVEDYSARDRVLIIMDDVTRAENLEKVLGDRQIDSGSFTFIGHSNTAVKEAPYTPDNMSEEEFMNRKSDVQEKIRDAVFSIMSERMVTGGRLVLARRFKKGPMADLKAIAKSMLGELRKNMKGLRKYWKPLLKKTAFVQLPEDSKSKLFVKDDAGMSESEIAALSNHACIMVLERNDTPWEEPNAQSEA